MLNYGKYPVVATGEFSLFAGTVYMDETAVRNGTLF
jgi:hypothetical protein